MKSLEAAQLVPAARWLGWLPGPSRSGPSADWAASPAVGRAAAGRQGRCVIWTPSSSPSSRRWTRRRCTTPSAVAVRPERHIDVRRRRMHGSGWSIWRPGADDQLRCGGVPVGGRRATPAGCRTPGCSPTPWPAPGGPGVLGRRPIAADPMSGRYAAVTARHTHRGGSAPFRCRPGSPHCAEAARNARCCARRQPTTSGTCAGCGRCRRPSTRCGWTAGARGRTGGLGRRTGCSARRDGIPPAAYPAGPAHTEPDFRAATSLPGAGGWPSPPRASALGVVCPADQCEQACRLRRPDRPCNGSCCAPPPAAWPRPCTASCLNYRSYTISSGSAERRGTSDDHPSRRHQPGLPRQYPPATSGMSCSERTEDTRQVTNDSSLPRRPRR